MEPNAESADRAASEANQIGQTDQTSQANPQSGVQVREVIREEFELGGKTIAFEAGLLARQADGAVTVRMGDAITLVTAVVAKEPTVGRDFLPVSVAVHG